MQTQEEPDMRLALCLVFSLGCLLLSGCAEGTYFNDHGYGYSHAPRGPRLWNWGEWNAAEQEPVIVYVPVYTHRAAPPPNVTPPEPIHRSFSAPSALAAIHALDLAPCTARGAPRGYGHAQITFLPDGKASTVLIDAPEGVPPDAVACLGASLGAARVPAFDGAPMTVGASYFMP
jgi:hypothetical protein